MKKKKRPFLAGVQGGVVPGVARFYLNNGSLTVVAVHQHKLLVRGGCASSAGKDIPSTNLQVHEHEVFNVGITHELIEIQPRI